jgi:hypothetical protein
MREDLQVYVATDENGQDYVTLRVGDYSLVLPISDQQAKDLVTLGLV